MLMPCRAMCRAVPAAVLNVPCKAYFTFKCRAMCRAMCRAVSCGVVGCRAVPAAVVNVPCKAHFTELAPQAPLGRVQFSSFLSNSGFGFYWTLVW